MYTHGHKSIEQWQETEALSDASTDKWEKNIKTFTSSYSIWLKN